MNWHLSFIFLWSDIVSEPDPRKIGKVNGAGWKCTLWNVRNFINCWTLQSL